MVCCISSRIRTQGSVRVRAQEAIDHGLGGRLGVGRHRLELAAGGVLGHRPARSSTINDQVDQAVGPQPIRAVDADAGALAGGVKAGNGRVVGVLDHPTVDVGRDAAHPIVGRGLDRHRLANWVDAEVGPGELDDVGQSLLDPGGVDRRAGRAGLVLVDGLGADVEIDVILAADPVAGPDLLIDRPRADIPTGEVFHVGGVLLHEALPLVVEHDAAVPPAGFAEQDAQSIDAGRVELVELQVFQGDPVAIGDGRAVAGQGISIGGDLEHPAEPAGRDQDALGVEGVELAGGDLDGHDPAALAVDHDEVKHVEFVEERHASLDALLVEGLEDHVAGPIGRVARAHDRDPGLGGLGPLGGVAVIDRVGLGVAAESSLRDPPVGRPVERQAHMLEVVDALDGLLAEDLGGGLVDEEVAALDGVVGVVLPRVILEVRQGGGDPPLGGAGVGPGGIELADDGGADPLAGLQRGHQARASGPDDDAVETMIIHATRMG